MPNRTKFIIEVALSLFVLSIFLKFTGILNLYRIVSYANKPTININSRLLVSNILGIDVGDFAVFNQKVNESGAWIFRVVAVENDTVEIKNGTVFRNGKNFDRNLKLVHLYKIPRGLYYQLSKANLLINDDYETLMDSVYVFIQDNIADLYKLESLRLKDRKGFVDKKIEDEFKNDWNKDFFGPIIIPKNKFFVMGDNRDDALDSRYIGFIDKKDIVGVAINY